MATKKREFEELQEKDLTKWAKPPKDPAVAEVVNAVKAFNTHTLYMNCYLSRSTIERLRKPNGTRKPQHMTLVGVLGAAGLEYAIRKRR